MSGAQHTPGPWRVFSHSWCDTSILAADFDHGICSLDINHATEESQEADEALMAANARLIAAAPALEEMLSIAVEVLKKVDPSGDPESDSILRDTIAASNELLAEIAGCVGRCAKAGAAP